MKLSRKTLKAKLTQLGNEEQAIALFAAEGYNPAAVRELIRLMKDKTRRQRGSEIFKFYAKAD